MDFLNCGTPGATRFFSWQRQATMQLQSDIPAEASDYTFLHLAGDVIAVIDALGEKQVFFDAM